MGEKTAAKLIQNHGTLEEVFAHIDELTPKLKANLLEAQERLLENREFFRFRGIDELAAYGTEVGLFDIGVEDLRMGDLDFTEVRKLFDALEFRVLFDRLAAIRPEAREAVEGFEAEVIEVSDRSILEKLLETLSGSEEVTARFIGDPAWMRQAPTAIVFADGDRAYVVRKDHFPDVRELLSKKALVTHNSKEAIERLAVMGIKPQPVAMDTEIAAYLLEPARGTYALDELARHYLGRELRLDTAEGSPQAEAQQSLLLEEPVGDTSDLGLQAIAVAELSDVLSKELKDKGADELFYELELPLAAVLAEIESTGIKIDVDYLNSLSAQTSKQLDEIQAQIFESAGEPFNIGSTRDLGRILYEKLGLKASKKTSTGKFSTDASVLETLRDEHPVVELILKHREKSKLKSTYLDALPPLVDPVTKRIHCRFNQTVAATGRLSSERPNLQNIPIRTQEGLQIRRAFIPEEGHTLIVADYSQIELRILAHLSKDEELVGAFRRGDDIHRLSIAKALGIEDSEVTPQLRSIGKMVSYGVTYGMGPFGLSQRLRIPVDQARTYIDGFFGLYPRVRSFLDEVVAQATKDGFTTTMLGRRRYVPELASHNPRVRSLGERQALNAPIQGSAADIIKLAMVRADRALGDRDARMVLTVHDELVFEVPDSQVEETAALIREAMEHAIELDVPMDVDLHWGKNWADAKS